MVFIKGFAGLRTARLHSRDGADGGQGGREGLCIRFTYITNL